MTDKTNDAGRELHAARQDLLMTAERWHASGCKTHEPLHRAAGRYGRARQHWVAIVGEEAA